jgi:hypothetical protein
LTQAAALLVCLNQYGFQFSDKDYLSRLKTENSSSGFVVHALLHTNDDDSICAGAWLIARKKKLLDQLAEDVAEQIVRLLYALGVAAGHDERQVAERRNAPAVAPQQPDDPQALFARLLTGNHNILRRARSCDRHERIAAPAKRFDLPREYIRKPCVVRNRSQHAAVGRKRKGGERAPPLPRKLIDELARDVLRIGRRAAIAAEQESPVRAETGGDHFSRADYFGRMFGKVAPLYFKAGGDD